jgi:hypothetical protein
MLGMGLWPVASLKGEEPQDTVLVLWCMRIKWLDKIREMLLRNTNRDLSIQGCIEPDRAVRRREPEALNRAPAIRAARTFLPSGHP